MLICKKVNFSLPRNRIDYLFVPSSLPLACLAAGANTYSYEEAGEEMEAEKAGGQQQTRGNVKEEEEEEEEEEGSAASASASAPAAAAEWELSRVVTIASCLECSSRSGPGAPESSYARLAALAGAVPDYLYGGKGEIFLRALLSPAFAHPRRIDVPSGKYFQPRRLPKKT